jgi:hypothetical protein
MSPPEKLLARIRAEYLEMPGLCLTLEQMQRLCGVDRTLCEFVVNSLVEAKFLCLKSTGAYGRLTDGGLVHPRAAKAGLKPSEAANQQLAHSSLDNYRRMKPRQLV